MTDHHKEDIISFQLDKPGRYRLYAFKVCPFAHRVRLVRLLQPGLQDAIQVTYASDQTLDNGILFDPPEPEFQATCLKDVYGKCCSNYSGKFSVPLVLDRRTHKMVHNESMDLALALAATNNGSTSSLLPKGVEELAKQLADKITLAPYKYLITEDASQKQEIANSLWAEYDKYETLLGTQDYLLRDSNQPSLADCILWISLIRHDNVYARMFGLNAKTIQRDYPHLTQFVRRLWNTPSANNTNTTLGEDVDMKELVRLYWQSPVLAPKAGHDPTAPVPEVLPVFLFFSLRMELEEGRGEQQY